MTACGLGFLRASRSAGLLASVFVVLGTASVALEPAVDVLGFVIALAVTVFVLRGFVGTLKLHRHRVRSGAADRRAPGFLWMGVPTAFTVAVLMAYGLACQLQLVPATEVVPGDRLAAHHIQSLRDAGVLEPDETVEWFYSGGVTSIFEDGSVLTDRRVISYERLKDDPFLTWTPFSDVARIELVQKGSLLADTQVDVVLQNGDSFVLLLSAEGGGDDRFIRALHRRVHAAHSML